MLFWEWSQVIRDKGKKSHQDNFLSIKNVQKVWGICNVNVLLNVLFLNSAGESGGDQITCCGFGHKSPMQRLE